ncbi:MAG: glycosyltransferase, partial [bacterium]|nr:glycosyltransferase [bacterium]
MKAFFSIVIPTLNEELFLPDLLNDLQKQKSKNFEIFVIDSKSVDKTKSIIQNWKGMTIRFYDNEKRNVSSQRNLGAQKSTGKYLVFLDADSRVGVYFTKKLEKEIAKNQGLFFVPAVKSDDASS